MEKNIETEVYLTLSKAGLSSTNKAASNEAEEAYGLTDESTADTLLHPSVNWHLDEIYFDKESESISLSGEFNSFGNKLGYMSHDIKISSELLIEIIEHYMKKLGKLKTVMEAIK